MGRLDGITALVPDTSLFLYMYVRKEAVLSSQIEGTQSTLNDLLRFESDAAAGAPVDDIREVSNYIAAMEHGLARLSKLPLSLRLIREMHEKLMASGRGHDEAARRFSHVAKLDRGHTARQCDVRPAPCARGNACAP